MKSDFKTVEDELKALHPDFTPEQIAQGRKDAETCVSVGLVLLLLMVCFIVLDFITRNSPPQVIIFL